MKNDLLIIGRIPPPIGGVTIHTKRLIDILKTEKLNFIFYNIKKFNLFSLIKNIRDSKITHVHLNNSLILFIISIICKYFNSKLIITIHGNLNDSFWSKSFMLNFIYNFLLNKALKSCSIPIVLNKKSLILAKKINVNSILITSFIPPANEKPLNDDLINKIKKFKNSGKLFCSNAFDFKYDKNNIEVYGIMSLINFFNKNSKLKFILSDPSNNYSNYFKTKNIKIGKNIFIINRPHSFFNILKYSDVFIRNTSIDGDSLSIREALFLKLNVIASDSVERPPGVINFKFNDDDSFKEFIKYILNKKNNFEKIRIKNGALELLKLYKKTLN